MSARERRYTIVTDSDSMTIEAATADAAATIFAKTVTETMAGYIGIETAEELRLQIEDVGGYGHMSENGIDLWRVQS